MWNRCEHRWNTTLKKGTSGSSLRFSQCYETISEKIKLWMIPCMKTRLWSIWSVNCPFRASLVTTKLWNSAVFAVLSCSPLSEAFWIIKREVARVPRSSVRSKSSFMPAHTACVRVEAGVVAGQWRPLRLRLHCCPLVNDRAVGSCSSVYAVIKHSKPTGWQQPHFPAPGLSVEKETCLTLCFPAQWNPAPEEERYQRKGVWFGGQIQCTMTDSRQNFSFLCFSGVTVNLTFMLRIWNCGWFFLSFIGADMPVLLNF